MAVFSAAVLFLAPMNWDILALMPILIALLTPNKITNKVQNQTKKQLQNAANKLGTKKKRLIVPEINKIFPSRSIFVNKAVENGKVLVDTLRDGLNKDLLYVMKESG